MSDSFIAHGKFFSRMNATAESGVSPTVNAPTIGRVGLSVGTSRSDDIEGATVPTFSARRPVTGPPFDLASAYDDHASSLLGFAIAMLRDRSTAEDCVQETFLRAWRARERFDPSTSGTRTWLFAIHRNVLTDTLRARGRTPPIASSPVAEDDATTPDTTGDVDDRMRVAEGLATLSAEHRHVVVAVHLTGISYAELSSVTGIPVGTLRTRTFYALRALRAHFDGQDIS